MAQDSKDRALKPEVAAKFRMVGGVLPGPTVVMLHREIKNADGEMEKTSTDRLVDFRNLTIDQVEDLIKSGCKDIEAITSGGSSSKPAGTP